MFLIFPYLHKELILREVSTNFFILNPGFEEKEGYWTPSNLPFTGKEAHKLLNEIKNFVNIHKDPKDVTVWRDWILFQDFEFKSFQIRSELLKRLKGEKESKEDFSVQAQYMLIFYWLFEEQIIELMKIERDLEEKEKKILLEIGVETSQEESKDFYVVSYPELLPWKRLLPYFFFFVPENFKILILDKFIFEDWKDLGISFKEKDSFLCAFVRMEDLIKDWDLKGGFQNKSYEVFFSI